MAALASSLARDSGPLSWPNASSADCTDCGSRQLSGLIGHYWKEESEADRLGPNGPYDRTMNICFSFSYSFPFSFSLSFFLSFSFSSFCCAPLSNAIKHNVRLANIMDLTTHCGHFFHLPIHCRGGQLAFCTRTPSAFFLRQLAAAAPLLCMYKTRVAGPPSRIIDLEESAYAKDLLFFFYLPWLAYLMK
jgi:hypothetical protein